MSPSDSRGIRKRLLRESGSAAAGETIEEPGEIDLASCATIAYSSEDPAHPIESLLAPGGGRDGPYWAAAQPDTPEQIVLEFDRPQSIGRLVYEVEESRRERTQEVAVEVSTDGGRAYSTVLRQEYNFSPQGATFQREDVRLGLRGVTHLRLNVVPNKSGSGTATLSSLRVFAA